VKILLISAYLRRSRKIEMKYSAINDNPVRWQRKAKYEEIEIAARKSPDSKLGISIKLVKPAWPLNALSSIIIATVDPLSRGDLSGLRVGQIIAAVKTIEEGDDTVHQLFGETLNFPRPLRKKP